MLFAFKGKTVIETGSNNLTITVDDQLTLYFDGVEQPGLPNVNNANVPDKVNLLDSVTTIAVQANNIQNNGGILGSDQDGRVLTSSAWKCTPVSYTHLTLPTSDL